MRPTIVLSAVALAVAQDPAQGWLGYATGTYPGAQRITLIEAYWKVGAQPRDSNSFYSPWFGIDASDNLNLLQPVNPWLGNQWQIYNEYFQWSPEHNENSASHNVKAGDELYGSITYRADTDSYDVYHKSLADNWDVSMNIPVQKVKGTAKNYTIAYFVYEKVAPCRDYPPDGSVTFTNITVQYDGKNVTDAVKWTTAFVEDVCNNRAAIIDPRTIAITWDTKAADPDAALIAASQATGLGQRRRGGA